MENVLTHSNVLNLIRFTESHAGGLIRDLAHPKPQQAEELRRKTIFFSNYVGSAVRPVASLYGHDLAPLAVKLRQAGHGADVTPHNQLLKETERLERIELKLDLLAANMVLLTTQQRREKDTTVIIREALNLGGAL